MSEQTEGAVGVHWSFWAIAGVTLLYNLAGVGNYMMQMDANNLAALPDAYREIIESRPSWATGAFALAVFGAALGCLLLLLRKSAALYVFIASLLGAVVTMMHTLGTAPLEFVIGNLVQLLVTVFLIWYAKHAQRKKWIS
ncbi:MAG: hypothetical protein ACR2PZ_16215 [Pseudomonadales bacterium]